MFEKLKTIIKSRLTKPKKDKEVERKREICKGCEYNSKNMERIPLNKRALKWLSDLYSKVMGRADEDNLGNCLACESCSVYYKSMFDSEECPKNKW